MLPVRERLLPPRTAGHRTKPTLTWSSNSVEKMTVVEAARGGHMEWVCEYRCPLNDTPLQTPSVYLYAPVGPVVQQVPSKSPDTKVVGSDPGRSLSLPDPWNKNEHFVSTVYVIRLGQLKWGKGKVESFSRYKLLRFEIQIRPGTAEGSCRIKILLC